MVVLVGVWLAQADTSGLSALTTGAAAGWMAAGVGIYCVGQLLNGLSWRYLLQQAGGAVSLGEMLLHDLSSVFWGTVLPGGVAGEVVKGFRLARDIDVGTVAVTLLAARLVSGTMACLLALACLPLSGFEGTVAAVGAAALVATAGVGVAGLVALRLGPAALPAALADRLPIGRFPALRSLAVVVVLGGLTHAAFALVYSAAFAAAGAWMPFAAAAVVSALTSVAQILPLTVGGLGVRELSISTLGAALFTDALADAGAISVAVVFTVFIGLGGLVELGRAVTRRR